MEMTSKVRFLKGRHLVKANDLGIRSKNLEDAPTRDKRKKYKMEDAIKNLTSTPMPDKLSLNDLPSFLTVGLRGD